MKLWDEVCSLKLSKKLKKLGVTQESRFYWWKFDGKYHLSFRFGERIICISNFNFFTTYGHKTEEYCSAFTASELGEMLPQEIFIEGNHYCGDYINNNFWLEFNRDCELSKTKIMKGWIYFYTNGENNIKFDYCQENWDTNESSSRAKLLIHILENNYIKL